MLGKGLDITGGNVGINFTTSNFPGGSITVLDSNFTGVTTGIIISQSPKNTKQQATVALLNVQYNNVPTMLVSQNSNAKLNGGTGTVKSWFIGTTYTPSSGGSADGKPGSTIGAEAIVPEGLRFAGSETSGVFTRPKPQYQDRSN